MEKGTYDDPKTLNKSKLWATTFGRLVKGLPTEMAPFDADTPVGSTNCFLLDSDYAAILNITATISDDSEDNYLISAAGAAAGATLPTLADNYGRILRFTAVNVTNAITIDGEGAETIGGKTTIPLEYVGQTLVVFGDASNGEWTVIGNGAAMYWHHIEFDSSSLSPGASGATAGTINTSTHCWLLDATNEYMYFGFAMHEDWDAASDIIVECCMALSAAETENDTINGELIVEYFGEHEDAGNPKTQTRTVDHDITDDNAQYKDHTLRFVLDHDLADNVIQRGDKVHCRFRLDAVGGAGEVAGVYYYGGQARYLSNTPAHIYNGTMPTEA